MEISIFNYISYKQFVCDKIESYPNKGRGIRKKIAEAAGCQVAYISHVLVSDREFSLEQGEAIGRFFSLRTDELDYFICLIEKTRAGTIQLQTFFDKKLSLMQENYRVLKNRIGKMGKISSEDQSTYYSSWHYQAIRMALTIPELRTAESISKHLNIPIAKVNDVLIFFLEKGLVKENKNEYLTTEQFINVGNDSRLLNRMHSNWRLHTLQKLDRSNPDDLHYSSAVTLSEADYFKVRNLLIEAITDCHKIIKPSKEEKLCVMSLDFYQV